MFSDLFRYDNPVMVFLGKFCDLMLINLFWLIASLPVFTIGASTTAVYYVTLKLAEDREGYTIRSFFSAFRSNFRQGVLLGLLEGVTGAVLLVDLYYYRKVSDSPLRGVALGLSLLVFFLWLAVTLWVFPLQARFENPIRRTLLNALLVSIRYLPRTILMMAADIAILVLMLCYLPPLLLFGMPLLAFANSYLLVPVFRQYMPPEED